MRSRSHDLLLRMLSLAVQQSPTITVITDTEGRIVYVNPSFSEITGQRSRSASRLK